MPIISELDAVQVFFNPEFGNYELFMPNGDKINYTTNINIENGSDFLTVKVTLLVNVVNERPVKVNE